MAFRWSTLLHLKLQDDDEFCSIVPTAENFETIDTAIAEDRTRLDSIETPNVTAAATLTQMENGNTFSQILGKLKTLITLFLSHVGGGGNAHGTATTSAAGFLSAEDKAKLDGIAAQANKYTHPSHTAKGNGLYKIVVDALGHVTSATAVQKSDITALGIPGSAESKDSICRSVKKNGTEQSTPITEGIRVGNIIIGYGHFTGSLAGGETAMFDWYSLTGWQPACAVPFSQESSIDIVSMHVYGGGNVRATLKNNGTNEEDTEGVNFIVVLVQDE